MNFDEYQQKSRATAMYPKVAIVQDVRDDGGGVFAQIMSEPLGWVYPAGKLGGECGELQEKLFKILRDDNGVTSEQKREAIKKELGDIIWYVAQLATEFDLSFSDVAQANLAKLADRKERGVIGGSGDDR